MSGPCGLVCTMRSVVESVVEDVDLQLATNGIVEIVVDEVDVELPARGILAVAASGQLWNTRCFTSLHST